MNKNLDLLTSKQLARYEDSLEVLRLMRTGESFNNATKLVNISPSTAKKLLGKILHKKGNKLVARKSDNLVRKLRIYENGKETFIQIKGSSKAVKIAQYHSAIGRRIEKDDKLALEPFKDKIIKDTKGNYHTFETDIHKILDILRKHESPEQFTIYRRH